MYYIQIREMTKIIIICGINNQFQEVTKTLLEDQNLNQKHVLTMGRNFLPISKYIHMSLKTNGVSTKVKQQIEFNFSCI